MITLPLKTLVAALALSGQWVNAAEDCAFAEWDQQYRIDLENSPISDIKDNLQISPERDLASIIRPGVPFNIEKPGKCVYGYKWVNTKRVTQESRKSKKTENHCATEKAGANAANNCKMIGNHKIEQSSTSYMVREQNHVKHCTLATVRDEVVRHTITTNDTTVKTVATKAPKGTKGGKFGGKAGKGRRLKGGKVGKGGKTSTTQTTTTNTQVKKVVVEAYGYRCTHWRKTACPQAAPDPQEILKPIAKRDPCTNDDQCFAFPGMRYRSLCDWAKDDLKRCRLEGEQVIRNTACKGKYNTIAHMCPLTCSKECRTEKPTEAPTMKPTICDDDNKCIVTHFKGKVISICDWVSKDLRRCKLKSNVYKHDGSTKCPRRNKTLGGICRKTCNICEAPTDAPTDSPTRSPVARRTPPDCDDDETCLSIIHETKLIPLCDFVKGNLNRCNLKTDNLVVDDTKPDYEAPYARYICRKSCNFCGGPDETQAPSQSPTECKDNEKCFAMPNRHSIINVCEWVKRSKNRCNFESSNYVTPESLPKGAPLLRDICQKTCGKCT